MQVSDSHKPTIAETGSGRGVGEDRVVTHVNGQQPELEDEIDFSYYRQTLLRQWKLLAAGAALGAIAGLTFAMMRPTLYEASTTVQVSQAASAVNIATARALLQNNTLAAQTINETGLSSPPFNLTPQAFIAAVGIDEIPGTTLVRVKVRLSDPRKAAEASTILSRKAVELNSRIASSGSESVRQKLQQHLDGAAERFQEAEAKLLKYQNEAQVEVLRADTEAMLDERGDLLKLLIEIETEKGRLAAAEQEILRHERVLSVGRSVGSEEALRRAASSSNSLLPSDPTRENAARENAARENAARENAKSPSPTSANKPGANRTRGNTPSDEGPAVSNRSGSSSRMTPLADPEALDLTNPFVNPVYQTLAFQIATSRTRLAGLERARREMVVVRKLGEDSFRQLSELHRRELELVELQARYELAAGVYSSLALRYEQSRSESVDRMVQLQVVDEAIPADQPLPKKHVQSTGMGLMAGLALAAIVALAWGSGAKTSDGTSSV